RLGWWEAASGSSLSLSAPKRLSIEGSDQATRLGKIVAAVLDAIKTESRVLYYAASDDQFEIGSKQTLNGYLELEASAETPGQDAR
ncbi:17091_t:CDS:2, partial [Acaulospora colombiana]